MISHKRVNDFFYETNYAYPRLLFSWYPCCMNCDKDLRVKQVDTITTEALPFFLSFPPLKKKFTLSFAKTFYVMLLISTDLLMTAR